MPARPSRSFHLLPLLLALGVAGCAEPEAQRTVAQGDADRGRAAIQRHGCVACHYVPGLASYGANVGPPLDELAGRAYLAGMLPNDPDNLVRWLRNPPAINPRTAMPDLGVSEADARDMAAYLYAKH